MLLHLYRLLFFPKSQLTLPLHDPPLTFCISALNARFARSSVERLASVAEGVEIWPLPAPGLAAFNLSFSLILSLSSSVNAILTSSRASYASPLISFTATSFRSTPLPLYTVLACCSSSTALEFHGSFCSNLRYGTRSESSDTA